MNISDSSDVRPHHAGKVREFLLLAGVPAWLFLNLFTLRGIPRLLIGDNRFFSFGDNQFFSFYAMRIQSGQVIYRDFLQFTPPGIDYIYLLAFHLFGIGAWVPSLVNLVIGTLLSWLAFSLARQLMPTSWAMLTCASFLVFLYGEFLDPTHHWYSLFFALLAVRVLMISRTPLYLAAAGTLIATAAFFTQTAGTAAYIGLMSALLYEHSRETPWRRTLRRLMLFTVSAAITWCLLNASLLAQAGWRLLWHYQVVYPLLYVNSTFANPLTALVRSFPHRAFLQQLEHLVVYTGLVSVTPVTLVLLWGRRLRNLPEPGQPMPLALLASVGFFLAFSDLLRANWLRLYAVALPSLILLFAAAAHLLRNHPRLRLRAAATLWAIIAVLAAHQVILRSSTYNEVVTLPAGRMAATPQHAEELRALASITHPGEFFLQVDFLPYLYYPLQLRSPIYADFLSLASVTRPEFLTEAVTGLEKNHVRFLVFQPHSAFFTNSPMEATQSDPFLAYIRSHYTFTRTFANGNELWQRVP